MKPKSIIEKQPEIEFINKDTVNVFTDIVKISITNETVSLELALRNKDNKTAIISHNIIMTMPHFLRFIQVGNGISEDILSKFKENK
ncbi:MAG: hypothetical protein PF484_00265 [Bacteroidales bacterium]|jgi:hypothetical protein|nr:hypothetical protein [Bacteroidales bacterium]